jgi:hypothetical protein
VADSTLIIAVPLAFEQLIAAALANATAIRNDNAIANRFVQGASFSIVVLSGIIQSIQNSILRPICSI